jgi:inorganic phosphate transporter, PiT family
VIDLLAAALIAVALAFAFSIGAHYTGACVGMPYAAGALRLWPALLMMAPLAFLGAAIASGKVEATVGHGILASGSVSLGLALAIVLSAFLLTSAYNFLTLPTSTIQILVFSAVGAGLGAGIAIDWTTIRDLLVLWAVAPVAAFAIGWLLVRAHDRWRSRAPASPSLPRSASVALVGIAAAASFAMGANDVANASGALVMTGLAGLLLAGLLGGVAIAVGALTWGQPILKRVAFRIVRLDPTMAFCSQLTQAGLILTYVSFGFFTSMNQTLVGAMIGTGVARGQVSGLWKSVSGILQGWALGPVSGVALGWVLGHVLVGFGR